MAYFLTSRHKNNALLNLRVLKYPRYVAALIASGINVIAIYMITFLMPLFLQSGLGISPLATGFIMLPASLFSIFAMPVATKLYPKIGERLLIVIGIIVLLIGSSPFLIATPTTPILLIAFAMCVRSCGMSAINLVATNAQMSDIPPELSGYASSLTNWLHQILNAMTVGIAGNIADLRIQQFAADDPNILALAYTNTTNLLMLVSAADRHYSHCIKIFPQQSRNEINSKQNNSKLKQIPVTPKTQRGFFLFLHAIIFDNICQIISRKIHLNLLLPDPDKRIFFPTIFPGK